jgi:hypothetical protein
VDEEVWSAAGGDADESDGADAGRIFSCGVFGWVFFWGDGFEFARGSGSGGSDEAGEQRN